VKPVFKKTILPRNAGRFCNESFPVGDKLGHGFLLAKRDNGMEVVGHGEQKLHPPFFSAQVMFGSRDDHIENLGISETVAATLRAVNRQEEFGAGFDPPRRCMKKALSLRQFHGLVGLHGDSEDSLAR
jgi:hypothetical protein